MAPVRKGAGSTGVEPASGGSLIRLRASPNSSRTAIKGFNRWRGEWEVSVAARPSDGEANAELVSYLAGLFGVPARAVAIRSGMHDHAKSVFVQGVSADRALARLREAAGG